MKNQSYPPFKIEHPHFSFLKASIPMTMYKTLAFASNLHCLKMDTAMPKEVSLMILVFWILAPTVDQLSDIAIVTKLLRGPGDDLEVSGGNSENMQAQTF